MNFLSAIVRGIDRLNEKVGRYVGLAHPHPGAGDHL